MNRVFELSQRAIDESRFAAVVIGEPEPNQRHIGIWHCAGDGNANVLHLAWHCLLCNHATPSYFSLWIELAFEPERLRQLAAFCRRVWRKNNATGIPYAFSAPRGAMRSFTGEILLGPTRFGLTCASFVLAVFEAAGLDLIQYNTWALNRPGDQEWQQQIIEKLRPRAEQSHIDKIQSEIGAVRYRPEEVAAGAALSPPPADFAAASEFGEQIVNWLWGSRH